jgi:hypothetical protein
MNFLDYITNAMSGGQPTQQELMARQMAQQGLLGQQTGASLSPEEFMKLQAQKLISQTGAAISPRELQGTSIRMTPEMIRNMTPPISGKGPMADQYRQNLFNPGMTMQQNYMDPRLIEQMYYRGLLSR